MQFTLQSLMLSFIVVASAIGVFGPWGILAAAYFVLVATLIRGARSRNRPGPAVLGFALLIVGCLISALQFNFTSKRNEDIRQFTTYRELPRGFAEREQQLAIVDPKERSGQCRIVKYELEFAHPVRDYFAIRLHADAPKIESGYLPLAKLLEELELGKKSKLVASCSTESAVGDLSEDIVVIAFTDGRTRYVSSVALSQKLRTWLDSGSDTIAFSEADTNPRRTDWRWVASLAVLILSEGVLILRPVPAVKVP